MENNSKKMDRCEIINPYCHNCLLLNRRITELEKELQDEIQKRKIDTEEKNEDNNDININDNTEFSENSEDGKDESIDDEKYLDLSHGRLHSISENNYTEDLFYQGQKGIVNFIYTYVLEKSNELYKCVDANKKLFIYIDETGECNDKKCKVLIDSIYNVLIKKVNKIYRIIINKIYEESEDSLQEEYDSDIEEVIAFELQFVDENGNIEDDSIDGRINDVVTKFLEIKKCFKNRKFIIDELSILLKSDK